MKEKLIFFLFTYLFSFYPIRINAQNETIISSDKIIFLNFLAENTNELNVTLISKKEVAGSFKELNNGNSYNNYFLFKFFDDNSNFIKQIIVEHPLLKNVEYVDELDKLNQKSLKLTKAEFFVRVNVKESINYFLLTEYIQGKQTEKTIKIDLKLSQQ